MPLFGFVRGVETPPFPCDSLFGLAGRHWTIRGDVFLEQLLMLGSLVARLLRSLRVGLDDATQNNIS